jgi:hypothetical protein
MLTIVGNGPSRKRYDLDNLENWWGCNLIYEDGTPDLLFAVDIPVQRELIEVGYYKDNMVYVGEWNPMCISLLDGIAMGYELSENGSRYKIKRYVRDTDTHFIVQGLWHDKDNMDIEFLGYDIQYESNLVVSENMELKNLSSGMHALGHAMFNGYKEITLIGFDMLQYGDCGNVYAGTGRFGYLNNYTEDTKVTVCQPAQFISLLKKFPDVNVYFKNELDELEKVEYDRLSYYETTEEWTLGKGIEGVDHGAFLKY